MPQAVLRVGLQPLETVGGIDDGPTLARWRLDAEFTGNYGLQLKWNDGHQTGIFSWELLRRWCGCPVCVPEET